jgi:SAM-dependent methyltransferase
MSNQVHWEEVYGGKSANEVSWFQPAPEPSLSVLDRFHVQSHSALIDVGGGASNLVDELLKRGCGHLTVLDIAEPALGAARQRIGRDADRVHWLVADVTLWKPVLTYDVWHDRAVFHFLVRPQERRAYRNAILQGLRPGGLAIIATFALDGPERCSGLPVRRYDARGLAAEFGPKFELADDWHEAHTTPAGAVQRFTWVVLRRRDGIAGEARD